MKQNLMSHKEIRFIFITFFVVVLLIVLSKLFSFYQLQKMYQITTDIYEHPLKVSNTALKIELEVYKIHKDMKDIVLATSKNEVSFLIKEVDWHEKNIYNNLSVIRKNILGKEGIKLHDKTKDLFSQWKPIRDEVITLVKNNNIDKATKITKGKGATHVKELEITSQKLYYYAQNKADSFINEFNTINDDIELMNLVVFSLILFIIFIFMYYAVNKTSKYIYNNEYLSRITSIIKELDKLIIREKDPQNLLKKCCEMLASNDVYENAWVIMVDEENKVEYFTSAIQTNNFSRFENNIKNNKLPECIRSILADKYTYNVYKNSLESCSQCPMLNDYEKGVVFNIKLSYKEVLYGYLSIVVSDEFLKNNDEISLIRQFVDDVSYALYNLKKEKHFKDTILKIEKLYDNILNSVDNLIFAKDNNFNYIACNKAFEKFIGRTKDEIIGKNDYDFFDKNIADEFRMHDKAMLKNNKPKSNFEWVTYPDGGKVYLYTTKAPLIDYDNKVFGLVGVSADFTKQKHTEDALELSRRRYEIAEKMGKVGNWEYIIKTKEFWASKESKMIFGLPIESTNFTTEEVESCIPDRERVHQALDDLIESKKEYNLEFEIYPSDGAASKIISSIAKLEYDEAGKAEKVIGFIQDITEMKQKDEMLINQSRHAAMGEMISMIAHQWRQPISVIAMDANNMIVDIALDDFEPKKAQEYSNSILEQTQHLSETINDFRNYFKPDKGITYVMVSKIINETYSIVKDSLINNNIEFNSSFESTMEVGAFERELMQVFVNIISNSKDALVGNNISNPYINVKVYDDKKYVNTEICDNGGGIDSSIMDKVFDPYFTTKDEMTGTGLGLYMSKLIVQEHLNGIIEVYNSEYGACFRIRLLKKSSTKNNSENSHE